MYKLIYGSFFGPEKRAGEFLSSYFSEYLDYTLPTVSAGSVSNTELCENDLIVLGTAGSNKILADLAARGLISSPEKPEGYTLKILKSPYCEEKMLIAILGFDAIGTMYGAVDLGAYVLPALDNADPDQRYPLNILTEGLLRDLEKSSSPAIKERGIWTWGHVIYNYKRYLSNMARLKMNTFILWNDHIPANIGEIIDEAHSYGIRIYLGFSWGWNEARQENGSLDISDDKRLADIQRSITENYKNNYLPLDIDGIYFQSFTEFREEFMNGVSIADRVVRFVNDTAAEILSLNPNLKLMFGLHATSVCKRLDAIRNTDSRITIVWEDLGAFPYAYTPRQLNSYEDTLSLGDEIAVLRGADDSFGVVTKGLICLDWLTFKHIKGEFIMGMQSEDFIKKRAREKAKVWKYIDAYWIKNASYAHNAIKRLVSANQSTLVTGLIEDGMFEEEIHSSAAIFAEMLWNPHRDVSNIVLDSLLRPDTV